MYSLEVFDVEEEDSADRTANYVRNLPQVFDPPPESHNPVIVPTIS